MKPFIEILIIAILTSTSCAILGNFLVTRKLSMMTDTISHTVLFGIVMTFFIVHEINSPYLILGATIMGLITVWLTETLLSTKLISSDSTLGIIFPFFFSMAVIAINLYAANSRIGTDTVLLGELAFAPFKRYFINGIDIGAQAMWISLFMLILNVLVVTFMYKELTIATFDETSSKLMGYSPRLIHYILMTLVSLTAVTSFQSIGSILLISFMIAPASSGALLTKTFENRIKVSVLISVISSIIGIITAIKLDTSLTGTISATLSIIFFTTLILKPIIHKKRLQKEIEI